MVIVVGNNHHNTLGLIRSLGRGGFDVICIVVDSTKHSFVSKSRYIKKFILIDTFENLMNLLRKTTYEERIPVFSTSDELAEKLDLHYNELSEKYILSSCEHKQGGISYWMNKDIMLSNATECGLMVPRGYYVKLVPEYVIPNGVSFPCIVKPHKSSEAKKDNVRICYNRHELEDALNGISPHCPEVLIQEYIKREYEVLIMGMRSSVNGITIIPGCLHKLRVCKHTKSLGMFTYAYTTGEIDPNIDINAVECFLKTLDYDGIFSMEFMIEKDKAYFLEINLRNDGTQFCFEGSGVNLPTMWAKTVLGEKCNMLKPRLDDKYCIVEINYLKNMDLKHPITAIKEWRKTSLFALADKTDLKPAFYKFIYSIFG